MKLVILRRSPDGSQDLFLGMVSEDVSDEELRMRSRPRS